MGDTEDMGGGGAVARKGPNAWLQITSAFVVVAALAGGLWKVQKNNGPEANGASVPVGPITCSTSTPTGLPTLMRPGVKYVSSNQLCQALNRSDLATLLGTPGERVMSYGGGDDSFTMVDGDIPAPEMKVTLTTYSVQLSVNFDHFAVKDMAHLLGGDARERTFLGRPAVLYSDRTLVFALLPGSETASGPGSPTRRLVVARDPKDGGGSYDVSLWRQDSEPPDDATLLRFAETVLPTIPGWTGS